MRCAWAGSNPLMVAYHDEEWGVPSRDDRYLFEMISLEGAQAGLSWDTILKKREGYRRGFHNFEAEQVAEMTDEDVERLVLDASIVRHRGKILSVITNAKAILRLREEGTTLADFVWQFAPADKGDGITMPTQTAESAAMSKALLKRGFRFVGATTMYAFMQAVGMVNDHSPECHWRG